MKGKTKITFIKERILICEHNIKMLHNSTFAISLKERKFAFLHGKFKWECPQAHKFVYLVPSWWKSLGRVRMFGIERDISVDSRFKVSKHLGHFQCALWLLFGVWDGVLSCSCHHNSTLPSLTISLCNCKPN